MPGLLDTIKGKANEFAANPLGMASLGLLMQPRRRPVGSSGWEYALSGMEAAQRNKMLQQDEEQMKQQAARQAMEDAQRERAYYLEAKQYSDKLAKAAQDEMEAQRGREAISQYVQGSGMDPALGAMLSANPALAQAYVESQLKPPSAASGALGRWQAAQQDPNQPFQGTLQDFMQWEASLKPPPSPNYQFIPTPEGIMAGNTRTGGLSMGMPGVLPANVDPRLAGQAAEAKATGSAMGASKAQSVISFPEAQAKAQATIGLMDALLTHPGLPGAVGAPGAGKIAAQIPGTKEAGFTALLNQIQGRQFLEAFESLKGGGQITEVEGQKATQAISRMNTAQSEAEFRAAAEEFKSIVSRALGRAQARVGASPQGRTSGVVDFSELPE